MDMRMVFFAAAVLAGTSAQGQTAISADEGRALSGELAEEARRDVEGLSFEEFRDRTLYVEETGKYYVNGDVPIRNEKLLREFWEQNIRDNPAAQDGVSPEFTVVNTGGLDQIWNGAERLNLTYCVSVEFGGRYREVVDAMIDATAPWEAAADIDFTHLAEHDLDCSNGGDVLFDVRPINVNGAFFAAAFFPNDPPQDRSVVIDGSSFEIDDLPGLTGLSLTGILRHELGHVLGGRHEHTRPEAGTCFEDENWRAVTDYDALSVMHYPHCNGLADWSLNLTENDRNGVACLYGPAPGAAFDPAACLTEEQPDVVVTETFGPEDIDEGAFVTLAMLQPKPATRMTVTMEGEGDPDLYVKVNGPVLRSNFDCRPFDVGAAEVCDFDVPDDAQFVNIAVHGYTAGRFEVTVDYTPLDGGT